MGEAPRIPGLRKGIMIRSYQRCGAAVADFSWMGGPRRRLMSGNVNDRTYWEKLEDDEGSELARCFRRLVQEELTIRNTGRAITV